jgi:hypothetical protein
LEIILGCFKLILKEQSMKKDHVMAGVTEFYGMGEEQDNYPIFAVKVSSLIIGLYLPYSLHR